MGATCEVPLVPWIGLQCREKSDDNKEEEELRREDKEMVVISVQVAELAMMVEPTAEMKPQK